jgi:cell cycle arrest protein BUB2
LFVYDGQEGGLLTVSSPNQILRNLPGLQARRIIDMAVSFSDKIPEDMYAEIVAHAK